MILVDTSVWIDHFRSGNDRLKALLLDEKVLCHPFVVGELACGSLQKRNEILTMLKALPQADLLEQDEVIRFMDVRRLYGKGIGWVDAHILSSTLFTRCTLWTLDKPLRRAAASLNVLM